MALKSWQTNKKNNAPQKKGQGKENPVAKNPANEKRTRHPTQDAEPRPEAATSPEAMSPALTTTEHAESHTSEVPEGEIEVVYEPTDTDVATASKPDLPAEEAEIEPVAPEADQTSPASEPEAEPPTAEPATATQTAPAESAPAQSEPAVAESGAEVQVIAVAPEKTQAAGEAPAPDETQVLGPARAEPAPAELGPVEPTPAAPAPAKPAPIGEAAVATEPPAAATELTPSAGAVAESEATPASKKTQPRERDARLPPAGTVLQRRDRHGNVRCECTIEQDGIRYAGKLYKSLSAAAIAATKDMGLKSKTQNGHTFWGVAKPTRPVRDTLESLERAWERYREHAEAIAAQNSTNKEERGRVGQAIEKHAETLAGLRARVA